MTCFVPLTVINSGVLKENVLWESVTRLTFHRTVPVVLSRATTNAPELRPLIPPHRLRQAKFGTALLVYGQLPPGWTEQRLYQSIDLRWWRRHR